MKRERVNWDVLWLTSAFMFSQRSVDPNTQHGCVFVDDNNCFISMGYNSFPRDCQDDKLPLTRPEKYEHIVHSEANAIINAKRSLEGATAYITGFPCPRCFSMMLNAGIKKIIYGPVGSHQIRETDIKAVNDMNISEKTGDKFKIEIRKYSDNIGDLNEIDNFLDQIKAYKHQKMQLKNVLNG